MPIASQRHRIRQQRLAELVEEAGGSTALSLRVGTPKSHVSALLAGTRGIGDTLAAKLERRFDRPPGWMDRPIAGGDGPERHAPEVAPGDWALLQAVKLLPEERQAEIRAEAARWRTLIEDAIARRIASGDPLPTPPSSATVVPLPDASKDTRPGLRKTAEQKGRTSTTKTKKGER